VIHEIPDEDSQTKGAKLRTPKAFSCDPHVFIPDENRIINMTARISFKKTNERSERVILLALKTC